MTLRVRFAPSPTANLHVGNARIALVNWLFARVRAGRVLLRLNDVDEERCKPRFAAAIEEDLIWLGLDWDEFTRQLQHIDRCRAAFGRLEDAGRIYPCYETSEELEAKRRSARTRGRQPVYDRAALALSGLDHGPELQDLLPLVGWARAATRLKGLRA